MAEEADLDSCSGESRKKLLAKSFESIDVYLKQVPCYITI